MDINIKIHRISTLKMNSKSLKKRGPTYIYRIYQKNDVNKWEYLGKFNGKQEASDRTGISTHTITNLVNGYFSIYNDKIKIIMTRN